MSKAYIQATHYPIVRNGPFIECECGWADFPDTEGTRWLEHFKSVDTVRLAALDLESFLENELEFVWTDASEKYAQISAAQQRKLEDLHDKLRYALELA